MRAIQNSQRLFIAVDLDHSLKQALQTQSLALQKDFSTANLRWSKPEQLHVTLKFLGDVSTDAINTLLNQLQDISFNIATPQIISQALVTFPEHHPRFLAVQLAPNPELLQLQQQIEQACATLGYPTETRKFFPHITLARSQRQQPLNLSLPKLTTPLQQPVHHITLFSSHPCEHGSEYEIIEQLPLHNHP